MTQAEVAAMAGISQGHYARVERSGVCAPEIAEKLAGIFAPDGITEVHVLYPARFAAANSASEPVI